MNEIGTVGSETGVKGLATQSGVDAGEGVESDEGADESCGSGRHSRLVMSLRCCQA